MGNLNISTKGNRGRGDLNHQQLRQNFNGALNSGDIARDTDANDIEIVTATKFVIDGVFYSKAAATGVNATITGADDDSTSQAAGTTCYYVYCYDSSGNVEVYKGVDDIAAYPAIPDDRAPFCVAKVVNTTNAFTLGTTDYNAAGVTTTFTDVQQVPSAVV